MCGVLITAVWVGLGFGGLVKGEGWGGGDLGCVRDVCVEDMFCYM
jgi:hypothetical protein